MKWRHYFIAASVLAILGAPSLALAARFSSGIFEGLALAVDPNGKITGYYEETQGEGVTKKCAFFLIGKATSDEIAVTTWSNRILHGRLKALDDAVELSIPAGREHAGCGLVLLPQVAQGMSLDLTAPRKWRTLLVVATARAVLHAKPMSKEVGGSLDKGSIVGVASDDGDWVYVEQISGNGLNGWMRAGDLTKLQGVKSF